MVNFQFLNVSGIEANGILEWILKGLEEIYTQFNEDWIDDIEIPEIFEEIFEWIGYATYIALAAGCLVAIISNDFQFLAKILKIFI